MGYPRHGNEDALPEDDSVVSGWNELDKRKGRVQITPMPSAEAGVEAFVNYHTQILK